MPSTAITQAKGIKNKLRPGFKVDVILPESELTNVEENNCGKKVIKIINKMNKIG